MDFYFRSALAPSSQRTYASAQHGYLKFCTTFHFTPLPVSEHQLCQFAAHSAGRSLTHSTTKGYLAAILHMQIAAGLPDPGMSNMPKLEGVIKGIKTTRARTMTTSRTRLPITPPILRSLGAVWEAQGLSHDTIMLWAAVTLCFFGFMRSGELTVPSDQAFDPSTHLTVGDVTVDDGANPSMLKLHLKTSKTDPFRRGVAVVVGRTNDKLCPVSATLAYLIRRGTGPGFLFQFKDGQNAVYGSSPSSVSLGRTQPEELRWPFLQNGAATTAHTCGLGDATIQMLGRWSSSAYLVYIRTPKEQLASLSSVLSTATS